MAAAVLTILPQGRGPGVFQGLAAIEVQVVAVATVYAGASGGLPIDLTGILQQGAPAGFAGPAGTQALNPADIVAVLPGFGLSTNGFLPIGITVGTPTYTTPPGLSTTDATAVPGFLATCPAFIRLMAIGAANTIGVGFGQAADGAITETFTFLLLVNRSGANN